MRRLLTILVFAIVAPMTFQNCSPLAPQNSGYSGVGALRVWGGTKQFGVSASQTQTTQLALDSNGNIYVVGHSSGPIDLSAGVANGSFISKFDKTGSRQWTKMLGQDGYEVHILGAAADLNGVYVTGWTNVGLAGNRLAGNVDFFIAKYGNDGSRKWVKQFGAPGVTAEGHKVAVDASNVVVVGSVSGQLEGATAVGDTDLFVMKVDSAGNKKWLKQMGVANKVTGANAVSTDPNSNIFVVGSSTGAFDSQPLKGAPDAIIVKFDSNGNRFWSRSWGSVGATTTASSVAADQSGNVYVTGVTNGALDGNTLTGKVDTFVAKFQTDGSRPWLKQVGLINAAIESYAVSVDRSSNISLTGCSLVDPVQAFRIAFLMTFDSTGNRTATKQFQAAGDVIGVSSASDFSRNLYLGGTVNGAGLDGNLAVGTSDSFLMKFDSTGVKQ